MIFLSIPCTFHIISYVMFLQCQYWEGSGKIQGKSREDQEKVLGGFKGRSREDQGKIKGSSREDQGKGSGPNWAGLGGVALEGHRKVHRKVRSAYYSNP